METARKQARRWFVPGEPVLSGGRGDKEWVETIRSVVGQTIRHPQLTFVVSSLRRRGHPFDIDNLVHPVLMAFEDPIDVVSARVYVGDDPGLWVEDRLPDDPPGSCLRQLYVPQHSRVSQRGRVGIPEIAHDPICDEHEGLGLYLAFDSSDIPIRKGWFGPVEAVIDDLVPWLGTYTSRHLIADHRIRDLRIRRGVAPGQAGVRLSLWYVPDDELNVPDSYRLPTEGAAAAQSVP